LDHAVSLQFRVFLIPRDDLLSKSNSSLNFQVFFRFPHKRDATKGGKRSGGR